MSPYSRRRPLNLSRRHLLQGLLAGCGWLGVGRPARAAAWPTCWQVDSLRFHADFPLRPDASCVQETLDLHRAIPQTLELEPRDELVYVFLFSDQATYRGYLRQYFPSVPYRRAMFIKQQGPGMVFAYYSDDFVIDLRHETTHAVLHTLLPLVPLWLDEGLAEYFEVPPEARRNGSPHLTQVQRNLRWHRPPSLTNLEAADTLEQMDRDAYRDAWSWVHFALHGPAAARQEFLAYLVDIYRHVPPGELSHRWQQRVPDLAAAYVRHFRQL